MAKEEAVVNLVAVLIIFMLGFLFPPLWGLLGIGVIVKVIKGFTG